MPRCEAFEALSGAPWTIPPDVGLMSTNMIDNPTTYSQGEKIEKSWNMLDEIYS